MIGDPSELFRIPVVDIDGEEMSLERWRGKLLLIVNPDDRKIVDIISPWKIVDVARP